MTRDIARPSLLRDLGLSDLGLLCRIMIAKVPEALWTVAFQMILVNSVIMFRLLGRPR
jgi:hypothetical protein